MLQGPFIPKFELITLVDIDLSFFLSEVRDPFFAESSKKAEIRPKIGQFCAIFFLDQ